MGTSKISNFFVRSRLGNKENVYGGSQKPLSLTVMWRPDLPNIQEIQKIAVRLRAR